MPLAFESFNFDDYDLVISVSSEAAKGVITKPQTKHICYCLTPTRYLWSHHDEYFKGLAFKVLTKPVVNYLRMWDKIAAQRPDVMLSISKAVQERVTKYYDRDSLIIYPPVDTRNFKVQDSKIKKEDYFLFVSRLVPYKKAGLAVEAFNNLGLPLVIIGAGSEEKKLRFLAKKNITFLKNLTDAELAHYYQNARSLIFPGEEDFGIVMVEAQAAGIPVVAYKKGGALDIITEGKTGLFFDEQSSESLIQAVRKLNKVKFIRENIVESTGKFSKEKFKKEFKKLVEETMGGKI